MGDAPSVLNCSYNITADIEVPEAGAEGMIADRKAAVSAATASTCSKASRSSSGTWWSYKRVRWEGPDALAPGKHTLEFDFKYDGLGYATLAFNNMSGIGRSGTGTLKVDGKEVATPEDGAHASRSSCNGTKASTSAPTPARPVCDQDYQCPFKFTGKLEQADGQDRPAEIDARRHQAARNKKASGTTGRASRIVGSDDGHGCVARCRLGYNCDGRAKGVSGIRANSSDRIAAARNMSETAYELEIYP